MCHRRKEEGYVPHRTSPLVTPFHYKRIICWDGTPKEINKFRLELYLDGLIHSGELYVGHGLS